MSSTVCSTSIYPGWKPIGGRDKSPQHRYTSSEHSRRLSVPAESLGELKSFFIFYQSLKNIVTCFQYLDQIGVRDNTSLKSTDALIPSTVNPNTRRSSLTQESNRSSISNGKRQNNRKFLRRKSSGGFENLSENLISKVSSVSTSILSSSSRFKQLRGATESETILYNTKRRGSLPIEALTVGLGELK